MWNCSLSNFFRFLEAPSRRKRNQKPCLQKSDTVRIHLVTFVKQGGETTTCFQLKTGEWFAQFWFIFVAKYPPVNVATSWKSRPTRPNLHCFEKPGTHPKNRSQKTRRQVSFKNTCTYWNLFSTWDASWAVAPSAQPVRVVSSLLYHFLATKKVVVSRETHLWQNFFKAHSNMKAEHVFCKHVVKAQVNVSWEVFFGMVFFLGIARVLSKGRSFMVVRGLPHRFILEMPGRRLVLKTRESGPS